MPNIIIKRYDHYNRAMGRWIGSRKEYEKAMVEGGYIPFEKAEQLAEQARARNTKKYDGLSEKTMKFLHGVKDMADKKGNIPITDKFVKGLRENGVKVDINYDKLPKHYQKGGFDNAT